MQVKPQQADALIKAPPPALRALLLYGPDSGLVRERGRAARIAVLGEGDDPFRLSELSGGDLKDDPTRLADEAAALSFTGGRRVVVLRDLTDAQARLVQDFLKDLPGEALVVVEAGDLPRRSALVKAFESAGAEAAAVACYRDEARDLGRVIDESLTANGLAASPDARAYLAANLGGDRLLTRQELDKLALYLAGGADGSRRVEIDDVLAVIGDSAALSLDDLAFSVASGDLPGVDRALKRSLQEGVTVVGLLRAVARHFQRLHLAVGLAAEGGDPDAALKKLRPPVFWKQAAPFKAQMRLWPPRALGAALGRLLEAEADCKRTGFPDEALAGRLLLDLAAQVAARSGRGR
ncbi:DNA polymerase III, delta subunit [Tistlia consotensis]|uniref:DNA-directed DNA polymerase n=1 Tax=Tistlia consotensis USBA 355 TaxID=560819 RepID=A0A1Y6BG65_9PROT|nr:DNA polymerase III subunit delta [Tistlia consotensis]SMF09121.1 DNA polymerase III, delta subunit [Tistlia consotensis USBA 355]SNR34831.1 DNA polymerase III, delta subunit [Tistlia consotensis]